MKQYLVGRMTLALSVGIHAYAFFATPEFTPAKAASPPEANMITFTVAPPKIEPAPEPEIEPEPAAPAEAAAPPPAAEPEPHDPAPSVPEPPSAPESEPSVEPQTEPAPSPAPTPAELTGSTLASLDGPGWDAPKGSGGERREALLPGVSRRVVSTSRRIRHPAPQAAPQAPPVLALAELSKHPVPPSLAQALERNYPNDARRQGQSGEAKVRARIESNGQVKLAKVAFESAQGFGAACLTTLLGSQWSAPLDKKGKPVATWVSYRCKFRINE